MARTSMEIQQDITRWSNILNENSSSAGSYASECNELQERISSLTQRRQALYDTYTELGMMCGALTAAVGLVQESCVMNTEGKTYLADQIGQYKSRTEGIINTAAGVLDFQLKLLKKSFSTASENAQSASGKADTARQKLLELKKELTEAADTEG